MITKLNIEKNVQIALEENLLPILQKHQVMTKKNWEIPVNVWHSEEIKRLIKYCISSIIDILKEPHQENDYSKTIKLNEDQIEIIEAANDTFIRALKMLEDKPDLNFFDLSNIFIKQKSLDNPGIYFNFYYQLISDYFGDVLNDLIEIDLWSEGENYNYHYLKTHPIFEKIIYKNFCYILNLFLKSILETQETFDQIFNQYKQHKNESN